MAVDARLLPQRRWDGRLKLSFLSSFCYWSWFIGEDSGLCNNGLMLRAILNGLEPCNTTLSGQVLLYLTSSTFQIIIYAFNCIGGCSRGDDPSIHPSISSLMAILGANFK